MSDPKFKDNFLKSFYIVTFFGSAVFTLFLVEAIFSKPITSSTKVMYVFSLTGLLIGYGFYNIVKNKSLLVKILVWIAYMAVTILCPLIILHYVRSDKVVVKKDWYLIDNGCMSFEYPYQITKPEDHFFSTLHAIYYTRTDYQGPEQKRLVDNIIYEYDPLLKDDYERPSPEQVLASDINAQLNAIKASQITYSDMEYDHNIAFCTVNYKIRNKDRSGYGIIYFNEAVYEVAYFLPRTKNYSPEFLERIKGSICIPDNIFDDWD